MSTLDDYVETEIRERKQRDRTEGFDAPPLVEEPSLENGDTLYSLTHEGLRYFFAERSRTTLELRSIERAETGMDVPSSVVAGTRYEDLPALVRKTLKLEGYRMVGRNSFLAGVL